MTVAEQLSEFPEASLTVRVTALAPRLLQLKLLGVTEVELTAQLSVLPLLIWPAVMLAFPAALNWTVRFWQIALGAILSTTVTVAVQLSVLPLASPTVKVTVFAPRLEQLKLLGLTESEVTPQLSVLLLLINAAVTLPLPLAFKLTVRFRQIALGAMLSLTVTVAVQLSVLPAASPTVKVTVFVPRLLQLNELGLTDVLVTAQLSVDPLLIRAAETLPLPLAFKFTVLF